LQISNDGRFQIVFESVPDGSDHVDVRLSCILAQTACTPNLFRGNVLAAIQGESKPKKGLLCISHELWKIAADTVAAVFDRRILEALQIHAIRLTSGQL
jgi:hypothetical protein